MSRVLTVRLSEQQLTAVQQAASACGLPMEGFARGMLFQGVRDYMSGGNLARLGAKHQRAEWPVVTEPLSLTSRSASELLLPDTHGVG